LVSTSSCGKRLITRLGPVSLLKKKAVVREGLYPISLSLVKIHELNWLMTKYPNYHMNPDGIIQWAMHCSINGDNKFLDDNSSMLRVGTAS
jgi:hypothetical protein